MSSAGDKDSGSSAAFGQPRINNTPISIAAFAQQAEVSEERIEKFFADACGGYDRYVELCKDPVGLELFLKRLMEEIT